MPRPDLPPALPFGRIVALHLVPGLLLLAWYVLATPWLRRTGLPSAFSLQVGLLFVVLPWMLVVLHRARRHPADVIAFRRPLRPWRYVALGGGLFVWAVLVFAVVGPWEFHLLADVFAWLPDWFWLNEDLTRYPRSVLLTTWVLALCVNGVAVPVVEEFYFRGYLLPRMPGRRAVAIGTHVVLFSLYHLFTPWQNLTRIVALVPLVATVYWTENVYVGMIAHAGLNLLGVLEALPDVLA